MFVELGLGLGSVRLVRVRGVPGRFEVLRNCRLGGVVTGEGSTRGSLAGGAKGCVGEAFRLGVAGFLIGVPVSL